MLTTTTLTKPRGTCTQTNIYEVDALIVIRIRPWSYMSIVCTISIKPMSMYSSNRYLWYLYSIGVGIADELVDQKLASSSLSYATMHGLFITTMGAAWSSVGGALVLGEHDVALALFGSLIAMAKRSQIQSSVSGLICQGMCSTSNVPWRAPVSCSL